MNFEAADALRKRIAKATGQELVGYNAPSLVTLVPHAQLAGNEQLSPLSPGTLIVRRGPGGKIIGTGIVEVGQQQSSRPPKHDLIGVTRLGLIDGSQTGRVDTWNKEELSPPTAEELIALLVPQG